MPNDDGHRTSIAVGQGQRGVPNPAALQGLGTQMPVQARGAPWGPLSDAIAPLSHNYELELTFGRTKPEVFDGPAPEFTEPPTGLFTFCQATGTWVDGTVPYVVASDLLTGASVKVNLLRVGGQDPNVRSPDILMCFKDTLGNYYATGNSYLDGQIGDVHAFHGAVSAIRPGWQLADGTNGTADLVDSFIKGCNSSGSNINSTGGSATHSHPVSGSTDSATANITVGTGNANISVTPNTIGITIDNYAGGATSFERAFVNPSYTEYAATGITETDYAATGITETDYATTGITATNATSLSLAGLDDVSANLCTTYQTLVGIGDEDVYVVGGDTIADPLCFDVTLDMDGEITVSPDPHDHSLSEPTNGGLGTGHFHDITEPTNGGAGTGHKHGITEPNAGMADEGHRHQLPDATHSHTSPAHGHTYSDSGHGHTATDSGHGHSAADSGHTHPVSGSTDAANGEPVHYILAWIERVH